MTAAACSETYGIRLGGALVVDIDTDTPEARAFVNAHFPKSPVRVKTARGWHAAINRDEDLTVSGR